MEKTSNRTKKKKGTFGSNKGERDIELKVKNSKLRSTSMSVDRKPNERKRAARLTSSKG